MRRDFVNGMTQILSLETFDMISKLCLALAVITKLPPIEMLSLESSTKLQNYLMIPCQ